MRGGITSVLCVLMALHTVVGECRSVQPPPASTSDRSGFLLNIVDADTLEPISFVSYRFRTSPVDQTHTTEWTSWAFGADIRGEYSLQCPRICMLEVEIQAEGYLGHAIRLPIYRESRRDSSVRLTPGVNLRGRVVDASNGKPIANAGVSPVAFAPPQFIPDTTRLVYSDSDGFFTLMLRRREAWLMIEKQDYLPLEVMLEADSIQIEAGEITLEEPFALHPGRTLRGILIDESGSGVSNARLSIGGMMACTTGLDGSFALAGLKRSEYRGGVRIGAVVDGLDALWQLGSFPSDDATLTLPPHTVISGHVCDESGNAIQRYQHGVMSLERNTRVPFGTKRIDNSEGRFDYHVACAGRYMVGIVAEGYAPWCTTLNVTADQKPIDVILSEGSIVTGRLLVTGRSTSERVVGNMRVEPRLQNAQIEQRYLEQMGQFLSSKAAIKNNGAFVCRHVPLGSHRLITDCTGMSNRAIDMTIFGRVHEIGQVRTSGSGCVVGRVIDGDGQPVGCTIGQLIEQLDGRERRVQFMTDQDGWFEIEAAPAGQIALEVELHVTGDILMTIDKTLKVVAGERVEVILSD